MNGIVPNNALKGKRSGNLLSPFRIAMIYAAIGGFWILFSDTLLAKLVADSATITKLSIYKGWAYVLVTALLLYWLVRRYVAGQWEMIIDLSESKQYNRTLFEQSPIGLALCRMDGSLVDVNEAFAKIVGRTVEETLKLTYWDITPKKYAEQEQAHLKSMKTTDRYGPYEKEYIHKDGRLIQVRLQGQLIEQRGEQFIWSSMEDITERKRAEEALYAKEFLLSESQRIGHIGSWGWDLTGPIRWTDETYRVYGVSPETFTPAIESLVNLLHPDDRPAMQRWLEACGAGQAPDDLEFRTILPDGTVRFIRGRGELIYDAENRPIHIYGTVQDITERHNAEEKIRTANEELLAINRVILTCSSTLDQKVILNIVMDEALRITGLEGGTICFVGPDETLHLAAHRETSDATIADLTTNVIKVGECLCGECARDRKPLILRDREAVLKFSTREAARGEDICFHAAFPLIVKGKCLGVLCVFTRTDRKPLDRSLKLLETVTAQIALAIENAQLYEDISRHAAMLEAKVKERTAELETRIAEIERMNKLFVDRELRMIELKEKMKELGKKL